VSSHKTVRFISLEAQQEVIKTDVERAFAEIFANSSYILGPKLAEFESTFAAYCETDFCIGVGNGFDALSISLKLLKLNASDEVIVPSNTYAATWLAVSNVGCKIIPVEPDERTFNLDPKAVLNRLSDKTKVIIPVHLYGQACDMTALAQVAEQHHAEIVEDNAQAHGARWNGRRTGSWGKINATSFYPTKNLGAMGDGGAITTSDADLANGCRALRNYGSLQKNYFQVKGINSRLDEVQAAILSIKLKHLDKWNSERRTIANLYDQRLAEIDHVTTPYCSPLAEHVYHLYVVRTSNRDELKNFLAQNGIETMTHYPVPPHLQNAYADAGLKKGDFPIAEKLANESLSLPIWPGMTADEIDYITEKIRAFYA
jgi:dTDP-4-amino-4,6-dideoxygalactose transaminase